MHYTYISYCIVIYGRIITNRFVTRTELLQRVVMRYIAFLAEPSWFRRSVHRLSPGRVCLPNRSRPVWTVRNTWRRPRSLPRRAWPGNNPHPEIVCENTGSERIAHRSLNYIVRCDLAQNSAFPTFQRQMHASWCWGEPFILVSDLGRSCIECGSIPSKLDESMSARTWLSLCFHDVIARRHQTVQPLTALEPGASPLGAYQEE